MGAAWRALEGELAVWQQAGRRVCLWWRDDDATSWTPQLERLVSLSEQSRLPLALAVVPNSPAADPLELDELERHLRAFPLVNVVQHGTSHLNGRPSGRLPAQFADDMPESAVAERIARGRDTLSSFLRFEAVYVPPWNVIQPNTLGSLRTLGFRGYSTCGSRVPDAVLPHVGVHVDLLRWNPAPSFRGEERTLRRLTRLIRQQRKAGRWNDPIGLLSHHLVSDEPVWDFLDRFCRWGAHHPALSWCSLSECFARLDADVRIPVWASPPVAGGAWAHGPRAGLAAFASGFASARAVTAQPPYQVAMRAVATATVMAAALFVFNANAGPLSTASGEEDGFVNYLFPSVDDGLAN